MHSVVQSCLLVCSSLMVVWGSLCDGEFPVQSERAIDFDDVELLQVGIKLAWKQNGKIEPIGKPSVGNRTHPHMQHLVSSMSATLDKLEMKSGSAQDDPLDIDPDAALDAEGDDELSDEARTLANFKTLIEDLMGFMEEEHDQDQTEFDTRKTQHTNCAGARRWQLGGDVYTAAADRDRWKAKHAACRQSERAWINYQTAASSSGVCPSASETSTQHDILAAHMTLAGSIATAVEKASFYESVDPVGKQLCAEDQSQFENHFCLWHAAHFYACSASQDCVTQTGLSELQELLLRRSLDRRQLWWSLQVVSCRVNNLMWSKSPEVSHDVARSTCSGIALDNDKFVLSSDIPSQPACAASSTMAPSTVDGSECAQFRQTHYAWDQSGYVIPTACLTTCPATTYTAWVIPAACGNEPSDCSFYNHHRNACGMYDSPEFVAGETCCACGGGAITTTTTTTTTTVLVAADFDVYDGWLTETPGRLTSTPYYTKGPHSQTAGHLLAQGKLNVTSNSGICGVQWTVTSSGVLIFGVKSGNTPDFPTNVTGLHSDYTFAMIDRVKTNPKNAPNHGDDVRVFEQGESKALIDKPSITATGDNVEAIRINSEGFAEYLLNGFNFYNSTTQVSYPWHLALVVNIEFDGPTLKDIAYLPCNSNR